MDYVMFSVDVLTKLLSNNGTNVTIKKTRHRYEIIIIVSKSIIECTLFQYQSNKKGST